VDHDTAEFSVESIARMVAPHGKKAYPDATEMLITAEGGWSNGYRSRLWRSSFSVSPIAPD